MSWNLDDAVGFLADDARRELIPGAALAAVTPEETVVRAVGSQALWPEKVPLEEDALYDLASLTKAVATTTLALQCLEEGRFTLQSQLCDLLPGFPHQGVTVEQLMTHTSGLPADDKAYKAHWGRAAMEEFVLGQPLEAPPGSRVVYSDFGYILLGFLVERYLGPLDKAAGERIFAPLGMADTGYRPADRGLGARCVPTEVEDGKAVQGVAHDGKARRLDGVSGNAGLFSTARDLGRFVQMLLGDGQYEGARILHPSTVGLLKKCYTPHLNLRRTLGWLADEKTNSFGDYYSGCCLYHTGFTGTSIYVDFVRRCGIVLLTNRVHPTRDNPHIKTVRDTVHNALLLAFDDPRG